DRAAALHARTPPLMSDQDFSDAQMAYDVAQSARNLAILDARAILATARTRKAELAAAEKRIRDARHVVPSGGGARVFLVAQRLVAVGDRVAIGDPLYRLVDPDPLRLRVQVPERRMAGVELGRPAKLWTAASTEPVAAT